MNLPLAKSVPLDWLLVAHRAGWVDVRNQETWDDQHQHRYHQGGYVEQYNQRDVQFEGSCLYVIAGWIETDKAGVHLKQYQTYADDVACQDAPTNDEGGKPQESMAD